MNADGSGQHRLTHPPKGTEDITADWSPDGSRIAFARAPSRGAHSIWVVRADGTGLLQLTPYCGPGRGMPKCKADDRSATERAAFGHPTPTSSAERDQRCRVRQDAGPISSPEPVPRSWRRLSSGDQSA